MFQKPFTLCWCGKCLLFFYVVLMTTPGWFQHVTWCKPTGASWDRILWTTRQGHNICSFSGDETLVHQKHPNSNLDLQALPAVVCSCERRLMKNPAVELKQETVRGKKIWYEPYMQSFPRVRNFLWVATRNLEERYRYSKKIRAAWKTKGCFDDHRVSLIRMLYISGTDEKCIWNCRTLHYWTLLIIIVLWKTPDIGTLQGIVVCQENPLCFSSMQFQFSVCTATLFAKLGVQAIY